MIQKWLPIQKASSTKSMQWAYHPNHSRLPPTTIHHIYLQPHRLSQTESTLITALPWGAVRATIPSGTFRTSVRCVTRGARREGWWPVSCRISWNSWSSWSRGINCVCAPLAWRRWFMMRVLVRRRLETRFPFRLTMTITLLLMMIVALIKERIIFQRRLLLMQMKQSFTTEPILMSITNKIQPAPSNLNPIPNPNLNKPKPPTNTSHPPWDNATNTSRYPEPYTPCSKRP